MYIRKWHIWQCFRWKYVSVNQFYVSLMTNQNIGNTSLVFLSVLFLKHHSTHGSGFTFEIDKKHVRFNFIRIGMPVDCLQIQECLRNMSLCKPSFHHGFTFYFFSPQKRPKSGMANEKTQCGFPGDVRTAQATCPTGLGCGLLKLRSLISPQAKFSIWQKYLLDSLNHVYIWQVPPQLRCGDTCQ